LPAAEPLDEFSFAIVSDTHLGRQDAKAPEQQWRQAVQEISRTASEFVLHLGDIVDGGRESQYPIYADILQGLGKPVYEVPGNHDPRISFEKYVRTPIDVVFDHRGVRFLLFSNVRSDSHLGYITSEQIRWLDDRCREAAAKDLRLVACCHVPIHTNAHPDRGWYVKPADGQTAFYEVVERYAERFLGCFHGHFHNGIRGWRDRGSLVEVLCPSNCYNQDRKLAEQIAAKKASGFFIEELRPGYVLATLGKGRLTMRYKPLALELNGEYSVEWK
jgi:3',5'-cyclic AMP phosphodiesterase CpdA